MQALKYITEVDANGHISLPEIPLLKSNRVEIIILPYQEDEEDLLRAAQSSTAFWNNKDDDEAWNDV